MTCFLFFYFLFCFFLVCINKKLFVCVFFLILNLDTAKSLLVSRHITKQIREMLSTKREFNNDSHFITLSQGISCIHYNKERITEIEDSANDWFRRGMDALNRVKSEGGSGYNHADILHNVTPSASQFVKQSSLPIHYNNNNNNNNKNNKHFNKNIKNQNYNKNNNNNNNESNDNEAGVAPKLTTIRRETTTGSKKKGMGKKHEDRTITWKDVEANEERKFTFV